MAKQLVEAMTGDFDAGSYKDEYRAALEAVIQAKVEGKETVSIEAPEESGKLIDLMAALEASVKSATAARSAAAGGEPVSVAEVREARDADAAKAATAAKTDGQDRDRQVEGDARRPRRRLRPKRRSKPMPKRTRRLPPNPFADARPPELIRDGLTSEVRWFLPVGFEMVPPKRN